MQIKTTAGVAQTKTQIMANMTDVTPAENKVYQYSAVAAELHQWWTTDGSNVFENGRKVAFVPGRKYTQAQIDALYPAATIESLTPATGAAAGGTVVLIKGQNLGGSTGVTFGATAGTAFSVVSDSQIQVTTPAKVAGTYDVIVTDDAGNVTKTGGFVYV